MQKDKPEVEFLTLDTMEIVTRGEGIKCEPDTDTIERLNSLASSETSKLFCPSYSKTKEKRKKETGKAAKNPTQGQRGSERRSEHAHNRRPY